MKNLALGILYLSTAAVITLLCILLYNQQQINEILALSHKQLELWLIEEKQKNTKSVLQNYYLGE